MALIGSVCALALVLGGLLFLIGLRKSGGKLVLFGILLAGLAGTVEELLRSIHASLGSVAPTITILLGIGVVVAAIRFRGHRRGLARWLGSPPSSLKKRVERD